MKSQLLLKALFTQMKVSHWWISIQTYSLKPYQNGYALVMEDFGGISLKYYFTSEQTRHTAFLQEFLRIA